MATQQDERRFQYLPTLVAAAPAFAAKGLVGDVGKGALEHATEAKLLGSRATIPGLLAYGARGRGLGRFAGSLLGVTTAPLFIHGTRLMQSDEKRERAKGLAMIGGATVAYAGARGFLENFARAKQTGLSPSVAASKGLLLGAVRSGYKLPIALTTAYAVARGRSKSEKGDSSAKYVTPALGGAAAGALGRAIEESAEQLSASKGRRLNLRKVRAAAGGGAVGGVLGGLLLAGAVEATERMGLTKKSSIRHNTKEASLTAAAIASAPFAAKALAPAAAATGAAIGKSLLSNLGHSLAVGLGVHSLTGVAAGYKDGVPGMLRRALPKRLVRSMEGGYNTARSRQFALGLKEGLVGRAQPSNRTSVLLNVTIPELVTNRQLGIQLGRALRQYSPQEREKLLRGAQSYMLQRPDLLKGTQGEANAVTLPALAGISMALGEVPMYRGRGRLTRTWKRLAIDNNIQGTGLPTKLGPLQAERGYFGRNAVHLGMAGGAVLGGAAGLFPHALATPISHAAWGGGKNAIVDLPAVRAIVHRGVNGGLRYGALPAAHPSRGARFGNQLADVVLSPAFTAMDRSVPPVVKVLRDDLMTAGFERARDAVRRVADLRYKTPRASAGSVVLPAAAATIAGGAALAEAHRRFGKSRGT